MLNKLEIYCKTEKSQVHGPDRFRKLPTCDHKFAEKRNTSSQFRKLQASAYSERLLTSETQYVQFAMKSSSCETYRKEVKGPRTLFFLNPQVLILSRYKYLQRNKLNIAFVTIRSQ